MELSHHDDGRFELSVSLEELGLLYAVTSEALEAVAEWEFVSRTGFDKEKAERVLDHLRQYLDEPQEFK